MAYYSTTILLRAGYSPIAALAGSLGFGVLNFVFALPAFWTIDVIGRRLLLLGTFPLMAASLALIAIAFGIDSHMSQDWSKAVILTGIYLFAVAYSPGEGPVPFVSDRPRHIFHQCLSMPRCTPLKACRSTIAISVMLPHPNPKSNTSLYLL